MDLETFKTKFAPYIALLVALVFGAYVVFFSGGQQDQMEQSEPQSNAKLEVGRQQSEPDVAIAGTQEAEIDSKSILTANQKDIEMGFDESGNPIDASMPDEFYTFLLKQIRAEWGDGSNIALTDSTATNSLLHSIKHTKAPMPNLSALSAKAIRGDMMPGDGFEFHDKDGKHVISLVLDSTMINEGDSDILKVAYVDYPKGTDLGSEQGPLNIVQAKQIKAEANIICASAYTKSPTPLEQRTDIVGGHFQNPVDISGVKQVEFYQPKFLYIDYNAKVDGVSVVCVPADADSSLRMNFVATGRGGYVGDTLVVEPSR